MGILSGRTLSALSLALIVAAAGAAIRVGMSGRLRGADGHEAPGVSRRSAEDSLARAAEARRAGNVAAALSFYREAVEKRPALVDRSSPEFLGPAFEASLNGWVSALRSRRHRADPSVLEDASFLFRRMNGGCG